MAKRAWTRRRQPWGMEGGRWKEGASACWQWMTSCRSSPNPLVHRRFRTFGCTTGSTISRQSASVPSHLQEPRLTSLFDPAWGRGHTRFFLAQGGHDRPRHPWQAEQLCAGRMAAQRAGRGHRLSDTSMLDPNAENFCGAFDFLRSHTTHLSSFRLAAWGL
jgi:hypothetical protein